MTECILYDLGYFGESECQKIKEKLEGKTYMNFHISWSNCCGNCTLIVGTECDETVEEIRTMFLHVALVNL